MVSAEAISEVEDLTGNSVWKRDLDSYSTNRMRRAEKVEQKYEKEEEWRVDLVRNESSGLDLPSRNSSSRNKRYLSLFLSLSLSLSLSLTLSLYVRKTTRRLINQSHRTNRSGDPTAVPTLLFSPHIEAAETATTVERLSCISVSTFILSSLLLHLLPFLLLSLNSCSQLD